VSAVRITRRLAVWGELHVGELGKGGKEGKYLRDWEKGFFAFTGSLERLLTPMRALTP
jgi:hypothetical protein